MPRSRLSPSTRLVFIDFDGTYADHGLVPPEHVRAVHEVRRNGHRVFLCTGRPRSMVPPEVLRGFDGLVSAAGGYVELDEQVLSDVRFPPELGARLVGLLDAHDAVYVLEAPEASYTSPGQLPRLHDLLNGAVKSEQGTNDILRRVIPVDDVTHRAFGKATVFGSPVPLGEVSEQFGGQVALLPSSLPDLGAGAGEFYLPHITKAVGIRVVCDHFEVEADVVVAIGDGWNDLEMIEFAGTGVAVHSAPPKVLEHAAFTIGGPTEHGLVQAFARLELT